MNPVTVIGIASLLNALSAMALLLGWVRLLHRIELIEQKLELRRPN